MYYMCVGGEWKGANSFFRELRPYEKGDKTENGTAKQKMAQLLPLIEYSFTFTEIISIFHGCMV